MQPGPLTNSTCKKTKKSHLAPVHCSWATGAARPETTWRTLERQQAPRIELQSSLTTQPFLRRHLLPHQCRRQCRLCLRDAAGSHHWAWTASSSLFCSPNLSWVSRQANRMQMPPTTSFSPKLSPKTKAANIVAHTGSDAKMTPASAPSTFAMAQVSTYSTPAVVTTPIQAKVASVEVSEERSDRTPSVAPCGPSLTNSHTAMATARVMHCQTVQPTASKPFCFA
mmetsp:Transcript_20578/g.71166  ORF Transcript_20578/g.71166 Transcript_20578/m.71166 type:complete len:225 (-) Transcript_20578:962-1636(-)